MSFKHVVVYCVLAGLGLGCGEQGPAADTDTRGGSGTDHEGEAAEPLSIAALPSDLPPGTTGATDVESVDVLGCRFTIGTARDANLPPRTITYIRKEALNDRICRNTGVAVVNASYAPSSVSLAKHPFLPLLVFSSSTKATPSGSAHTGLFLAQVSYFDLSIVRSNGLLAMSPAGQPALGNVYTGDVAVEWDGDVTVSGTFNGMIPGMTGSGTNYRAHYEDFLFGGASNPVPDSVVAF